MGEFVLSLYMTLMAVIFAGIANMAFCKSGVLNNLYIPMDQGKKLKDGKRLFGDNKTWKGFLGMILFGGIFQIFWGFLLKFFPYLESLNLFYTQYNNSVINNLWIGLLLGFAYVLFELPNSFIKRRLAIQPGKPAEDRWKWLFVFIDQADSLVGCGLILAILVPISFQQFIGCIVIGFGTHILVNQFLYRMKLRKNPF